MLKTACTFLITLNLSLFLGGCGSLFKKKVRDKDREAAQLYLQIGTSYLSKGQYPQALRELLQARKLDPLNPVVHNHLGLVYYVRDKKELALESLLEALRLKDDYTEARNNLGRVLIDLGRPEEAIAELERVTKDLLYAQPEKGWIHLGMAYFQMGQFEKTKSSLDQALKLKRNSCPARTLYGRTLLKQKRYQLARQTLEQAISFCQKAQPKSYDEALYFSSLSYLKTGHSQRAKVQFQELVHQFPQSPYSTKAQSYLKLIN